MNRRGPRPNLHLHYPELHYVSFLRPNLLWPRHLHYPELHYLSFLRPNLLWPSKPKAWPYISCLKVARSRAAPLQEVLNEVMYVTPQTP